MLTKPNGGHGSTVLYGYRYALENGADYIFQTDSDGQTDPEEFEKFWQIREGYDAIFGNRTSRGDGFSRAVVEKVLCAVLWTYFHVSVPDANAPFRLMKTDYVAEYLPLMPENYNLPNALMTAFGAYFHRKIRFIAPEDTKISSCPAFFTSLKILQSFSVLLMLILPLVWVNVDVPTFTTIRITTS